MMNPEHHIFISFWITAGAGLINLVLIHAEVNLPFRGIRPRQAAACCGAGWGKDPPYIETK